MQNFHIAIGNGNKTNLTKDELIQKLQEENNMLRERIKKLDEFQKIIIKAKKEWESGIDALPYLVFLVDKRYKIIRLNKATAKAIGSDFKDIIGQKCYELIHNTNKPPDYCPAKEIFRHRKPCTFESFENNLGFYCEVTVTPFCGLDGKVLGTIHIMRDITEHKKMEKERARLQAELLQSQKLEAIGQLAAGIAHEINTPTQYIGTNIDFLDEAFEDLRGLVGRFMELLEAARQGKVDEDLIRQVDEAIEEVDWEYIEQEVPDAIDQSRDGVRRVTSIVRAMKDFSHPGGDEKEPVDINKILETTITIARNEWKYVADLRTQFDSDLPLVPCLANEMGQVFLNLLVNAAHAIGSRLGDNPEGEKGTITILTRKVDDKVEIRISDTGLGIPEEIRDRIFEPFFTTKEVGKGTGQGLAIARNVVVEKHQGSIFFETEIGVGTTFVVQLPFKPE